MTPATRTGILREMTKRQGDGQKLGGDGPPAGEPGGDSLVLPTLAGVAAVLLVAFAIWRGLDRAHQLAARTAQAPAPAVQQGPDPNRVYTIETAGAPVRGPIGAPVTVAEFADFQ